MQLSDVATVLKNDLLDLLFPTCCLGCERRGEWLCEACTTRSVLTRSLEHCKLCNKITGMPGALCRTHQRELSLTGLVSFGNYRAFPLRQAIRRLKYEGVWASVPALVAAGSSRYAPILLAREWTAIVPIPLSPTRFRERGFNQAELIAQSVVQHVNRDTPAEIFAEDRRGIQRHSANNSAAVSPIQLGLVRTKDTQHQTTLGREQRRANIHNAFAWEGERLDGSVLLVDDVVTTGATLAEAARVLRTAGARYVWALTLAYEPPEK